MKMSDKDKELRRWSQGRECFTSASGTLEEVELGEKRVCKLKMTVFVKVKQSACCRSGQRRISFGSSSDRNKAFVVGIEHESR